MSSLKNKEKLSAAKTLQKLEHTYDDEKIKEIINNQERLMLQLKESIRLEKQYRHVPSRYLDSMKYCELFRNSA